MERSRWSRVFCEQEVTSCLHEGGSNCLEAVPARREMKDEHLVFRFETRDEDAPIKPTGFAHKFLPAQQWLGVKSELRRILEQLSKSYVRTQRDDLEVEQTRLDHRECSEESLGFPHIITLEN